MAKFQVVEKSFVNNKLVEVGEIVEVNTDPAKGGMKPGANLKPYKGGSSAPADSGQGDDTLAQGDAGQGDQTGDGK